jgi:hypothetical protein
MCHQHGSAVAENSTVTGMVNLLTVIRVQMSEVCNVAWLGGRSDSKKQVSSKCKTLYGFPLLLMSHESYFVFHLFCRSCSFQDIWF